MCKRNHLLSRREKVKSYLSMGLLLYAIILYCIYQTIGNFICIFAMLFSLFGDVCLNYNKMKKSTFESGVFFFSIAHAYYIAAYGNKLNCNFSNLFNFGSITVGIAAIVVCSTLVVGMFLRKSFPKIKRFVVCSLYMLIISIDVFVISAVSYTTGSFATLGAILFLLSDALLGVEQLWIHGKNPNILDNIIWVTYVGAQFTLLTSV